MSVKALAANKGQDVELSVSGLLDETAELPAFPQTIPGKLIVDLAGVVMINSLGCRIWVNWIRTVKANGGVFLVKCSPPVVHQINILVGFLPDNVKVNSFYVPYACQDCNEESFILLEEGTGFNGNGVVGLKEVMTCPHCKGEMTLDVIEARYFKFLQKK